MSDLISRQEALRPYEKLRGDDVISVRTIQDNLRFLPSVASVAEPCEDAVSRDCQEPIIEELENICINNEYVLNLLSELKNAPSVTVGQVRPKGEWMEDYHSVLDGIGQCHCSICGRTVSYCLDNDMTVKEEYPFCNCGADMRGEENADKVTNQR